MSLSYGLRLLCLLTVVAGFITVASQLVLVINQQIILRCLEAASARSRERILYLFQVVPLLLAIVVAGGVCLPEYLWHEPRHKAEPVGWITLLLAVAVWIWFGRALLRGLRITMRTLRFARICRRCGHTVQRADGRPILAFSQPIRPLGLVGFFRPFVLISTELLEPGGLNAAALQVALDHERSHALQLDNWKLLSLSFLPCLPADRWRRHWQTAADWAADEEAAGGDPARSLLLAEALIRTARSAGSSPGPVVCAASTSAEASLAIRIDRLLRPRPGSRSAGTSLLLALTGVIVLAMSATAIAPPWIYSVSEHILHLGGF